MADKESLSLQDYTLILSEDVNIFYVALVLENHRHKI